MVHIEQQTERLDSLLVPVAQLLDALPDAVLVTTADGRIGAVNSNLCHLAGYSRNAIIGRPVEVLIPDHMHALHEDLRPVDVSDRWSRRTLRTRRDIILRRADDIEVRVDVALSTVTVAHERVVVVTMRDASVRRRSEIRAAQEWAFLASMNDLADALRNETDRDATLRLVTDRACALLDADFGVLVLPDPERDGILVVRATVGDRAAPLLGTRHPADDSKLGWSTRHEDIVLVTNGSTDTRLFRPTSWPSDSGVTLVVPLLARDRTIGTLVIAKVSGAPMFAAADIALVRSFARYAALALNFAGTQEVEERAHRSEIAAEHSEAQLEQQREVVERLEELAQQKNDFVSRISHELRTPLSSILGFVEMLVDGDPGATTTEQDKMLTIVERNGRRLLALIENLLLISRVESGGFAIELRRLDLEQVIANVVEIVGPSLAHGKIELTVELGAPTWLVADRDQLERALLNLVSNAVKFTPEGGRIWIESETNGDDMAISVRDTGCGIPAEEQSNLFTRFFRTAAARTGEVPGTGLGLYIVKEIVTRHGGTIEVHSTRAGSTFTARLPVRGLVGPARP